MLKRAFGLQYKVMLTKLYILETSRGAESSIVAENSMTFVM